MYQHAFGNYAHGFYVSGHGPPAGRGKLFVVRKKTANVLAVGVFAEFTLVFLAGVLHVLFRRKSEPHLGRTDLGELLPVAVEAIKEFMRGLYRRAEFHPELRAGAFRRLVLLGRQHAGR